MNTKLPWELSQCSYCLIVRIFHHIYKKNGNIFILPTWLFLITVLFIASYLYLLKILMCRYITRAVLWPKKKPIKI